MYIKDLPVSTSFAHNTQSASFFPWYLHPAHLSLTTNKFWWQPSTHIQPSTGIIAGEEWKHVGRPAPSFRRVRESACYSSQDLCSSCKYVCVAMCMCVSGILRSTAGIHTGRHSQIGFYQNPDGQRNHKDSCQQIPAAGTGREMLFLSRYSAPFISDNGFLFVRSGISEPEPCL